MISLCVAASNYIEGLVPHEDITDIVIDTTQKNLSLVDEIIFVYQWGEGPVKVEKVGNLTIKRTSIESISHVDNHFNSLYHAVDLAKNDMVMFSDTDVFYYADCSKIFSEYMEKYDIQYVGTQFYEYQSKWIRNFPCVISFLTRKEFLPPTKNTKDINGEIYKWSKKNKYNWLSFETYNIQTYYQNRYASNLKLGKQPETKLLFHRTSQAPNLKMYKEYRDFYLNSSA